MTTAGGFRSDFSSLADEYAVYRTSYGDDLFNTIADFSRAATPNSPGTAQPRRLRALDVACGTGLSTAGLIARGYAVTGVDVASEMIAHARQNIAGDVALYEAHAESLPFADGAFELVTCGQAFHWFDAGRAFAEIARVLHRRGAVALFWKHALADDRFEACAAALLQEISGRDEPFNLARSHSGRFEEFWTERRAFFDHEEWRLPLELSFTVDSFVGYHSSREIARFHLGARRAEFLTRLRNKIGEMTAGGAFAVRAMQYLYLARKR